MRFRSPRLRLFQLTAAALTMAMTAMPGLAEAPGPEAQQPRSGAPQQLQPSLAGLPLYTSDGKEIGTVIAMGLDDDNEPVLVAEIARPLGLGPMAIAVPPDMFVRKGDHIELTLTESEVNAKLGE